MQELQLRLKSLQERMTEVKLSFSLLQGQENEILRGLQFASNQCESYKFLQTSYERIQLFFQSLGTNEQVKLQRWIESMVTYGLQCVFGTRYGFRISEPEIKGNEVSIDFDVIDSTGRPRDPYEEMGGGVADVLAFLLQFIIVHLMKDRCAQIMFLDEDCKHLSPEYRQPMANLLRELVERTNVQIVLVTHEHKYAEAADKVYRFTKPDNLTTIEQIV